MSTANVKAVITAEDRASGVISGVGGSFGKLTGAMALGQLAAQGVTKAFDAMVGAVKTGLRVSADLESSRQGFVTLLNSAEKADKVMQRIKDEARRTPFEIPGLTAATQALALVTKDGDKSVDILMDVGKALAAAGKGQPELDRIIANLQQIGLTGKTTEMDIRQFGMNGINILELVAEQYGITTAAAAEMQDRGEITFEVLTEALRKAGAEGGKFEKAFANQAGTFNQLVSNMKDNINIFLSDFVKQTGIFDLLKKGMTDFGTFMQANSASLITMFTNIFSAVRRVAEYISIYYTAAFTTIRDNWYIVKPALDELWANIETQLLPALRRLWEQVGPTLGPALKSLGTVVGVTLIAAIYGLATAINVLTTVASSFINAFATITGVIKTAVGWVQSLALSYFTLRSSIIASLNGIYEAIVSPFRAAFNTILGGIDQVKRAIGQLSPGNVAGNLGSGLRSLLPGNATGTGFFQGGLTKVGEQGTEIVNLPRGASVTPANSMNRHSNTNQTPVNITIQAGAYMGSQQDARTYAKMMFEALKDHAAMNGTTVAQLLGT